MMCTRFDICHVVGMVSRYRSNLGQEHWKTIKMILRYLKGITSYSLCYQINDLQLKGYTNAYWGGDLDERKSTSRLHSYSTMVSYLGVVRTNFA